MLRELAVKVDPEHAHFFEKVFVRDDAPYGIEIGIDNGCMGWRSSQVTPEQAEQVAAWLVEAAAVKRAAASS